MSVRPATTQISLGIRLVWSESSQWAQWLAEDPRFLHADSEDSDQTGRMPRMIWVFAGRTAILLVLSCRGSIMVVYIFSSAAVSRINIYILFWYIFQFSLFLKNPFETPRGFE